eukprot:jgi/Tetstr1/429134/TSEL_019096.t1
MVSQLGTSSSRCLLPHTAPRDLSPAAQPNTQPPPIIRRDLLVGGFPGVAARVGRRRTARRLVGAEIA